MLPWLCSNSGVVRPYVRYVYDWAHRAATANLKSQILISATLQLQQAKRSIMCSYRPFLAISLATLLASDRTEAFVSCDGLMFFAAKKYYEAEALVRNDPLVANECVDWTLNGWISEVGDI